MHSIHIYYIYIYRYTHANYRYTYLPYDTLPYNDRSPRWWSMHLNLPPVTVCQWTEITVMSQLFHYNHLRVLKALSIVLGWNLARGGVSSCLTPSLKVCSLVLGKVQSDSGDSRACLYSSYTTTSGSSTAFTTYRIPEWNVQTSWSNVIKYSMWEVIRLV